MHYQGMAELVASVSLDPWFNRSTIVSIWEVGSVEGVTELMYNRVSQLEDCALVG